MKRYQIMIEAALEAHCGRALPHLRGPMRYALLSGGRRIRPMLTLAWCEACGGRAENALPLAVAVELVHTMRLLHDDLPCMDGAEICWGLPCLHRAYGEAAAVLTGDAMLAEAFGAAARAALPAERMVRAVNLLSAAAERMAEGQAEEASGAPEDAAAWGRIHAGKTAALLEAACVLGVLASSGFPADERDAAVYGNSLGMAYQLLDDVHDGDGAAALLGNEQAKQMAREYLRACEVRGNTPAHQWLNSLPKAVME